MKKIVIKMLTKLEEHQGEKVIINIWNYGRNDIETATLKKVNYFNNIEVVSKGIFRAIPFVSTICGIGSITLKKTNEVLYCNPFVDSKFNDRSPEEIEKIKEKMFGKGTDDNQTKKIKQLELDKDKYSFIRTGLPFIKTETQDEWVDCVRHNINDGYSRCILTTAIMCLGKIYATKQPESVIEVFKEVQLSGFAEGVVANIVSYFSPYGEEFRIHWNNKHGVPSDEKGVVNPAILALKIK